MKEQGVGETLIGLISSTSIALWFFFGLLWGRLADKTGRPDRIVLLGGISLGMVIVYLGYCHTVMKYCG